MALRAHYLSLVTLLIFVGALNGEVFSCGEGSESAECILKEEHSLMQVPATHLLSMSSKDWPARIAKVFSHRFDPVGDAASATEAEPGQAKIDAESEAETEAESEPQIEVQTKAETDDENAEAGIEIEEAGIEEAGIEEAAFEEEEEIEGIEVVLNEPWWEIEKHLALAAVALKDMGGPDVSVQAQEVLSSLANVSGPMINSVSESLLNQTSGVLDAVKTSGVLDAVKNQTSGVLDAVKNQTSGVLDAVKNQTSGVLDAVQNSTENMLNRTADVLVNMKNTTAGVMNRTADALDDLQDKTAGMINATADVLDAVQNTTADILEDVSAVAQNISDAVRNISAHTIRIVRNTTLELFEDISILLDAVGPYLTPFLAKKHGLLVRVGDIAKVTGVRGEELAKAPMSFQGDMVPESKDQLLLFQEIAKGKRQHPFVAAGKPWKGGKVQYCFASDIGHEVRAHFTAAVEQVVRATCLEFEDVGWLSGDSEADTHAQRCNAEPAIFVMSRPNYGCFSVVGESSLPSQQLQLQHPGCTTQGVILHEIGHSLGMAHEHARPDRDEYIKVNWDNIEPQWKDAFDISNESYVDLPYEYLSLMHYDPYAFSKEDGVLPTIEAAGGHDGDIGQRNGFAEADILQLIEMYKVEVPTCSGRTIAGTGCINMPGDDGSDVCTGLTSCGGGITNERCCACGGGVEIQCYDGESCQSTPRLHRDDQRSCIVDQTALFISHGEAVDADACIIHNACDTALKFKCQAATCTHPINAGSYQSDFCQDLPVTQICTHPELCEAWDPDEKAQYGNATTVADTTAGATTVANTTAGATTVATTTAGATTVATTTAGNTTVATSIAGATTVATATAGAVIARTAVKDEVAAETATFAPRPMSTDAEDAGKADEETDTKQQPGRTHQLLVGAAATCAVVLVGLTIHSFWAAAVVAQ